MTQILSTTKPLSKKIADGDDFPTSQAVFPSLVFAVEYEDVNFVAGTYTDKINGMVITDTGTPVDKTEDGIPLFASFDGSEIIPSIAPIPSGTTETLVISVIPRGGIFNATKSATFDYGGATTSIGIAASLGVGWVGADAGAYDTLAEIVTDSQANDICIAVGVNWTGNVSKKYAYSSLNTTVQTVTGVHTVAGLAAGQSTTQGTIILPRGNGVGCSGCYAFHLQGGLPEDSVIEDIITWMGKNPGKISPLLAGLV